MTFPKRWLDDDAANASTRDVLRAGRGMDPPEGAENAVWLALAGQIGAAGAAAGAAKTAAGLSAKAAAGTAGSAAPGVAASGGLLKSILIGAFGGIVAVTGYSALEPASPEPPATTSPAIVAPAPTRDRPESKSPSNPGQTAAPTAEAAPPARPSGEPLPPSSATPASTASTADSPGDAAQGANGAGSAAPAPGSPEERESRIREESDMLNRARAALRGGDTAGANRLLNEAGQKFGGGALGQEREALAIETLAKSGAKAEASARAAAFIKAHPNSPHAARLQVFVVP